MASLGPFFTNQKTVDFVYEKCLNDRDITELGEYFTSKQTAEYIFEHTKQYLSTRKHFYDPCAGTGGLLSMFLSKGYIFNHMSLNEIHPDFYSYLCYKYEDTPVNICNIDMLEDISDNQYDFVCSDIPYGHKKEYKIYTKIKNILSDDGIACLVVPKFLISNERIYSDSDIVILNVVPNDSRSVILIFKKNNQHDMKKAKRKLSFDDIMLSKKPKI